MIMIHQPAEIFLELLVAGGYGDKSTNPDATWTISKHKMPDDPRTAVSEKQYITIYDLAPTPMSVGAMNGQRKEFFGWQILARGEDDTAARNKLAAIGVYFDSIYKLTFTVGTTAYVIHRIKRTLPPLFLKQNEKANMRIWTMEGSVSLYPLGA